MILSQDLRETIVRHLPLYLQFTCQCGVTIRFESFFPVLSLWHFFSDQMSYLGRLRADVNDIAQVELFNQLVNVSGVGVHLVAGNRLRGAPVSPPVMSDYAISPLEKEHHLGIPVVS